MVTADKNGPEDPALEAFFAAGRAADLTPPEGLMARVLAEAEAAQAAAAAPAPVAKPGRLAGLLAGLGGWPALAGLASAAVAGLWVGVAVPEASAYVGLGGTGVSEAAYDLSDIGLVDLGADF